MEAYSIPISLLRQTAFCPRIPYFVEVLGLAVNSPLWVRQGIDEHKQAEKRLHKRTLIWLGIEKADTIYRAKVRSEQFQLHGIIDMLLVGQNEICPVEFKSGNSRTGRGIIAQVYAYGIAAQETYDKVFNHGLLVDNATNRVRELKNSDDNREAFENLYNEMCLAINASTLPDTAASEHQCSQCEFFKHCNDR